jgi:hypothetical protein
MISHALGSALALVRDRFRRPTPPYPGFARGRAADAPTRRRFRDTDQEASFNRDGYLIVEDVFDRSDAEQALHVFRAGDDPINALPFAATVQSRDVVRRAAIDRELKAIIWPKLGHMMDDYRLCFATFLSKTPLQSEVAGAGEVGLHQDPTFLDEGQYDAVGVWAPLIDVDETNGCLRVIPGSHRWNTGPRGPATPFAYPTHLPMLCQKLRAVPMRAGSAMLFSVKLFHASQPNRGTEPRVAVGGLLAPREAQLYCLYPSRKRGRMDVYEIDDLFYTRYVYHSLPQGVPRVGWIPYWHSPLDGV